MTYESYDRIQGLEACEDRDLLIEAVDRFPGIHYFKEEQVSFYRLNPGNDKKKLFRVEFGEDVIKCRMVAVVTDKNQNGSKLLKHAVLEHLNDYTYQTVPMVLHMQDVNGYNVLFREDVAGQTLDEFYMDTDLPSAKAHRAIARSLGTVLGEIHCKTGLIPSRPHDRNFTVQKNGGYHVRVIDAGQFRPGSVNELLEVLTQREWRRRECNDMFSRGVFEQAFHKAVDGSH